MLLILCALALGTLVIDGGLRLAGGWIGQDLCEHEAQAILTDGGAR